MINRRALMKEFADAADDHMLELSAARSALYGAAYIWAEESAAAGVSLSDIVEVLMLYQEHFTTRTFAQIVAAACAAKEQSCES